MLIAIDESDPRPAYVQIVAGIKQQVHAGLLSPGDELPSVRELAGDLGINLHTARHAYLVLSQEGVIRLRLGRRARVAPPRLVPTDTAAEQKLTARLREMITDAFHMGVSDERLRQLVNQALATPDGQPPARKRRSGP